MTRLSVRQASPPLCWGRRHPGERGSVQGGRGEQKAGGQGCWAGVGGRREAAGGARVERRSLAWHLRACVCCSNPPPSRVKARVDAGFACDSLAFLNIVLAAGLHAPVALALLLRAPRAQPGERRGRRSRTRPPPPLPAPCPSSSATASCAAPPSPPAAPDAGGLPAPPPAPQAAQTPLPRCPPPHGWPPARGSSPPAPPPPCAPHQSPCAAGGNAGGGGVCVRASAVDVPRPAPCPLHRLTSSSRPAPLAARG